MAERPTFSQSWSRVSRLAPALRPQVEVTRHLFRGEPWHVVHDPVSNSFFRLNPVAYHLVGLMDGHRSVDEAWRLTLDRFGDAAPTQNEVIGLLGQLNESNLLRVDLPADAEPLLRRHGQRRLKWWAGQAMSVLFLRIPIFNPDRLVTILLPLMKWMMTKWGMAFWFLVVGYGIYEFIPHLETFVKDATSILAPTNWGWMIVLFIGIKAIHELGHGLVCKRFGGVVPEMGIMLLVLFPAPYVDATSAWAIPSKWKRFLVGSAGMVFELFIAALAVHVWIRSAEGSLIRQLSYNLIFMASVSTILFNANPLLRFDGYYMLSDVIEVPNLYQRAQNMLKYLIKRFAYGMENTPPVATSGKEAFWLVFYGIAALIYRVLILFGIITFIAGKFFQLGLAIAVWSAFAWGVVPLCKFIHWLATHPSLYEHRARATLVTVGFAALLLGLTGIVPMDDHRRAPGIVLAGERAQLSIQTDGFVSKVHVEPGQYVREGDIIIEADNPFLAARAKEVEAELERLGIALRQAVAEDAQAVKQVRGRIEALEETQREIAKRLAQLTILSPVSGTLVIPDLDRLEGQFLKRGELIGSVENQDELHVSAFVGQSDSAAVVGHVASAEVRTAGRLGTPLDTSVTWVAPIGRTQLPHPALGYAGGGPIATRPDDAEGMQAQQPQFEIRLAMPTSHYEDGRERTVPAALPGERVYVRFTLDEKKPLLIQWIHTLRQMFRQRMSAGT